jgi:hypothetical protein
MSLGSGPIVTELEEPERPGLADDVAADLLTDLAGEGHEYRLRRLPASSREDVRALIVENEHLAVVVHEHRARRHDQIERRLHRGEETGKDEGRHTPDDVSGRDRDEALDLGQ